MQQGDPVLIDKFNIEINKTRGKMSKCNKESSIGLVIKKIADYNNGMVIKSVENNENKVICAYLIDQKITVIYKYSSRGYNGEYQFNFNKKNIKEISDIFSSYKNSYILLILHDIHEVCCLNYEEFNTLQSNRRNSVINNVKEDNLLIFVKAEKYKSLRAYVKSAGRKNQIAGEEIIVKRKSFPEKIFGKKSIFHRKLCI